MRRRRGAAGSPPSRRHRTWRASSTAYCDRRHEMTLSIRRLCAALGAEVLGVDIAKEIDDETFAAIERAYNEHSVLVFPDQDFNEEQHLRFSRRFGEIEVQDRKSVV